ncbi:MAG TPA: DUF1801 domain-containing protein [Candidatus Dormibacteraeota bacterium]|nr:DUF1801 domain-containing protein [Candidatus Dormibacteraeota bacterium]
MKKNPEVEQWFKEVKPPAEKALRRVREIILRADRRMTEYVKYRTVQFAYEGDFANFVQYNKPDVNVMFNRGARIPGKFPHLEGTHPSARFMRFKDEKEVESRAAELTRLTQAWCAMMTAAASKPAKPLRRT